MHPNVPGYKESNPRILGRKIGYAAFCLVAPELFVLLATGEWLDVKEMSKEMKEIMKVQGMKEGGKVEVS